MQETSPQAATEPSDATRVRIGSDGSAESAHYGGADDPYEAIKVIEAWRLGFHLGNTVKYISRAGKKPGESEVKDLKKALFYLKRRIENLEKRGP